MNFAYASIAVAAVLSVLGAVRLLYTYCGNKLGPRDLAAYEAMERARPYLAAGWALA